MTAGQKRAYVLADNRLAQNTAWDEEILAEELRVVIKDGVNELDTVGFTIAETDALIEGLATEEDGDPADDALPDPDKVVARCNPGDLWQLGPHRLICGDANDGATLDALMAGHPARVVFNGLPYNVPINGHVSRLGNIRHREFAMASGEMTPDAFTAFLCGALTQLAEHSADGSIHFICMDWRHISELLAAGQSVYAEIKNLIVWVKDNGGMGSFYRSRHELMLAFKKGRAPHLNSFELSQLL